MKKVSTILGMLFLGMTSVVASSTAEGIRNLGYQDSFIFDESGITFSVYPDGEFDFYMNNRAGVNVGARIGNVGLTFNTGFDYNPFIQYDDYGAVIQIENVPIFYDFYGRVSQIGGIDIWYQNGRINRLGGLYVNYYGNGIGRCNGFINRWNRNYVYRPFHRWFARPAVGFFNVWDTPYRRYYNPVRYTWYSPYRSNIRRAYAQIGRAHRYDIERRANIYRNDRRVVRNEARRNDADRYRRSENIRTERGREGSLGRSSRTVSTERNQARVNRNDSRIVRTDRNTQRGQNVRTVERSETRKTVTRPDNRSNKVTKTVVRTRDSRTTERTSPRNNSVSRKQVVSGRSTGESTARKSSVNTRSNSAQSRTAARNNRSGY